MIALFLFVLLFNTSVLADAVPRETRQPKCKNPKGKLWSTMLDKDCGQSVCQKKGNKGVWQQCPRPATLDRLQEMEGTMLSALEKLGEKIEEQCGHKTPTFGLETTTPMKIDCRCGPWGSWSSCDSKTGKKKRTRTCSPPVNGGLSCTGSLSPTQEVSCPVDGKWGSWGSWSSCVSMTGKKKRERKCDNPAPLNGGKICPGASTEEISCSGLMVDEKGYRYYKIPIKSGVRLVEGSVADTCEAVGMKAVCRGQPGCNYGSGRCVVTPLEDDCNWNMKPLSKKVCDGEENARKCPPIQGLFQYMNGWSCGECGVFKNAWCACGKNLVSGVDGNFFAYCVETKNEFLLVDNEYEYYKVAVPTGVRLVEGAVADACEAAGMKAVCRGHSPCTYGSGRCVVTPLEDDCNWNMRPLSKAICNGEVDARKCPPIQGLFQYMNGWSCGECGVFKGAWCACGKNLVSGVDGNFFAYCALSVKTGRMSLDSKQQTSNLTATGEDFKPPSHYVKPITSQPRKHAMPENADTDSTSMVEHYKDDGNTPLDKQDHDFQ